MATEWVFRGGAFSGMTPVEAVKEHGPGRVLPYVKECMDSAGKKEKDYEAKMAACQAAFDHAGKAEEEVASGEPTLEEMMDVARESYDHVKWGGKRGAKVFLEERLLMALAYGVSHLRSKGSDKAKIFINALCGKEVV